MRSKLLTGHGDVDDYYLKYGYSTGLMGGTLQSLKL